MHLKDVPPNSLVRLYPDAAEWHEYPYAICRGDRGWFLPDTDLDPNAYETGGWGWVWTWPEGEALRYGGDVVLSGLSDEDIARLVACETEDEIEVLVCNLGTPATLRARAAALQAEAEDLLRRADAIEAGEAGQCRS